MVHLEYFLQIIFLLLEEHALEFTIFISGTSSELLLTETSLFWSRLFVFAA